MSILTSDVQECGVAAGSDGVECTLEVMVLATRGGEVQASGFLAEVLGSKRAPDGDRPTLSGLQILRTRVYVPLAWVHLLRTAGEDPGLLEKVLWPAAQRRLEYSDCTMRPPPSGITHHQPVPV